MWVMIANVALLLVCGVQLLTHSRNVRSVKLPFIVCMLGVELGNVAILSVLWRTVNLLRNFSDGSSLVRNFNMCTDQGWVQLRNCN